LSARLPLGGSRGGLLCRKHQAGGFSLLEVMFAMAIVGVLFISLYAAIANSISWIKICQENGRVTQILSDKLDTIRLYNWTQINSNGFVPTSFVVGIDPFNTNSTPYYTGTISIAQAPNPLNAYYKSNIVQVTVTVDWVSGSRPQNRSMDTYVAKYGLQSYIMR
jgi:prepilin-type N-terminal cleavage/methylation domain-containing protein